MYDWLTITCGDRILAGAKEYVDKRLEELAEQLANDDDEFAE